MDENETIQLEPLEITSDPTSTRSILQAIIDTLSGPDGSSMSWPIAQAVTKLKEARFWLGEEMFGEKPVIKSAEEELGW